MFSMLLPFHVDVKIRNNREKFLRSFKTQITKSLMRPMDKTNERITKHLHLEIKQAIRTGENVDNNSGFPLVYKGFLLRGVYLHKKPKWERNNDVVSVTRQISLFAPRPYLRALEYGTEPFRPNWSRLYKWAKSKTGQNPHLARILAGRIFGKIAREGIKPRRFIRNSILITKKRMRKIFYISVNEEAKRIRKGT